MERITTLRAIKLVGMGTAAVVVFAGTTLVARGGNGLTGRSTHGNLGIRCDRSVQ